MKNNLLVSISCITYNHVDYIKQALDSFLMQKTDFKFEVLVHDDASTDGTREIIEEYQLKYPDIIKPILQSENQYSKGIRGISATYNFPRAKGKYIALCEGDDFWTDETKLQRQVDFLEKNKDYNICFHPVEVFFENKDQEGYVYPQDKKGFNLKRLIASNFIQTNSVIFRNRDFSKMNRHIMPGDWYLHLYNAQYGKIGFIDRIMSAYRRHDGGVWGLSQGDVWKRHGINHLELYKELSKMYDSTVYRSIIDLNIKEAVYGIMKYSDMEDLKNGSISKFMDNIAMTVVDYYEDNQGLVSDISKIKEESDLKNQEIKKIEGVNAALRSENKAIKGSRSYKLALSMSKSFNSIKNIFRYNK